MKSTVNLFSFRKIILLFIIGLFFASSPSLFAWTGPTQSPPNGNVSAPVNVGTTDQVKNAGLSVNALVVFGNALLSGVSRYFNFGTTAGSTGYGFRDSAGTMEFKNSGGSWTGVGGSSGPTPWLVSGTNVYYNGGNVGIGTASPGAALQVQGDIRSSTGIFSNTEANDYVKIDPADDSFRFFSNDAERLSVLNSGNVGIGTASPTEKLDVVGDVKGTGFCIGSSCITSWPSGGSGFTGSGSTNYVTKFTGATSLGNSTIYDNGNVGIGTAAPSQKLEVNGNLRLSPANPYIYSGGSYITIPNGLYVSGGTPYFQTQIQARGGIHNDSASYLTIAGGTTGYTYFSGNVGFRTTDNYYNVDINGSFHVSGNVYTDRSINALEEIWSNQRVLANGDIKSVYGHLIWSDNQTGGNYACYSGSGPYNLGRCSSLQELKTNIQDLNLGLEAVMKLRPRTFYWKDLETDGGRQNLGFIAEEVNDVDPLLAEYSGGELLGVRYPYLTALLTKAIQQLKAENDRQTAENESLRAELKDVRKEVDEIRQQIER